MLASRFPAFPSATTALVAALVVSAALLPTASTARGQALARSQRAGAVPSAAAAFSPAHVPTAEELREAGWSPAKDPAPAPPAVRKPELPVQRGVALLANDPASLPRPELVADPAAPVQVPLAAQPKMFERHESPEGSLLRWKARVRAREAGGGAWIVEVDVPPFRQRERPDQADLRAAFARAERHLATAPVQASRMLRTDPGRRFRLEPREPPEPPAPLASGTSLAPLEGEIEDDALLLYLPGSGWWTASLGEKAREAGSHRLTAASLFVTDQGVFASPVARADDAALELAAWRPPSTSPRFLPFPRPEEAPWRCVVQDLRRHEGRLEALVAVHDPRLRRGPELESADSWAAHLAFDGSSWTELERLALPGDTRALRLRFDPAAAGGVLLEHEDEPIGRRPLERR